MNIYYSDTCLKRGTLLIQDLKSLLPYKFQNGLNRAKQLEPIMVDIVELLEEKISFPNPFIFVCFKESELKEHITTIKRKFGERIAGFLNYDDKAEVYKSTFDRIINQNISYVAAEGMSVEELKDFYNESLKELERVKKIHKNVVPIRKEHFKNISLYSKFLPGFKSGGEVFDMIQCGNSIVIALGAFESYLGASVLLKNLYDLSNHHEIQKTNLEDFLENFVNDCRDIEIIDKDDFIKLQLDLICFDMSSLDMTTYHFGGGNLFLNENKVFEGNEFIVNENNFSPAHLSLKLKRNDRLVFFSPGFMNALKNNNTEIKSLIDDLVSFKSEEALNEAMFVIKKGIKDSFLDRDASILIFEVNNHALVKI